MVTLNLTRRAIYFHQFFTANRGRRVEELPEASNIAPVGACIHTDRAENRGAFGRRVKNREQEEEKGTSEDISGSSATA